MIIYYHDLDTHLLPFRIHSIKLKLKISTLSRIMYSGSDNSTLLKATGKVLSLQRKAFIDENLSATEMFSKKSLCWYDLQMEQGDFEDKDTILESVNSWAKDIAVEAQKIVSPDTEIMLHPLVKSAKVFASDRVHY